MVIRVCLLHTRIYGRAVGVPQTVIPSKLGDTEAIIVLSVPFLFRWPAFVLDGVNAMRRGTNHLRASSNSEGSAVFINVGPASALSCFKYLRLSLRWAAWVVRSTVDGGVSFALRLVQHVSQMALIS